MKNASSQITRPAKRARIDSTTTAGAGILPLLPSREERAGERRAVLLAIGVVTSSVVPLSPLVPRREREQAGSKPVRICWYCLVGLSGCAPRPTPGSARGNL